MIGLFGDTHSRVWVVLELNGGVIVDDELEVM